MHAAYEDWHLWFAWRPVKTLNGRWVWLRRLYRSGWRVNGFMLHPRYQD